MGILLGGGERSLLLCVLGSECAPALADLPQPAFDLGALLLAPRQVAAQIVLLALQTGALLLALTDLGLDRLGSLLALADGGLGGLHGNA
ncbi:MAG: hypothetical protein KDE01_27375, partial [Caldilineaceae bacterium]|nr:hypothetical protein [Caldilineaceae bacterium]